jgi:hypothetical protein
MTQDSALKTNLTAIVENQKLPERFRQSAQAILNVGFTRPAGIGGEGLSAREVLNVTCLSREQYVTLARNFRQEWTRTSLQLGTNHPDMPRTLAAMLRETSEMLNGQDNRSPERIYDRDRALLASRQTAPEISSASCPAPTPQVARDAERQRS